MWIIPLDDRFIIEDGNLFVFGRKHQKHSLRFEMFIRLFELRGDGVSSRRTHKETRDALFLRSREKGSMKCESKSYKQVKDTVAVATTSDS